MPRLVDLVTQLYAEFGEGSDPIPINLDLIYSKLFQGNPGPEDDREWSDFRRRRRRVLHNSLNTLVRRGQLDVYEDPWRRKRTRCYRPFDILNRLAEEAGPVTETENITQE